MAISGDPPWLVRADVLGPKGLGFAIGGSVGNNPPLSMRRGDPGPKGLGYPGAGEFSGGIDSWGDKKP